MLQKVVDDYTSELTPAEIDSHYTDAWIKKEEQSVELSKFKKALIAKDWATARSTYETFSNWTLEAMHAKVVLQLQNSLNTKKSKASL